MKRISLYFALLSGLLFSGVPYELLLPVQDYSVVPQTPLRGDLGIPPSRQLRQRRVPITISFSLSVPSQTSAGIFQNNVLVRTLWSGQRREAGNYNLQYEWDGNNDAGTQVTDGTYQVQVLSNNVSYEWEGVVGNTSTSKTGSTVHHSSEGMVYGMVITGTNAYYTNGYHERTNTLFKFNTSTPQERTWIDNEAGAKSLHVDSDGTNVYWACEGVGLGADNTTPFETYVIATKVSDNSYVTFSSGVSKPSHLGKTYASAIAVQNMTTRTGLAGLAVQRTGSYLFVSNNDAGNLKVYNKTTGALVQTLTHAAIGQIKVDGADNLWMVKGTSVQKFVVNGDGTLAAASITLSGLVAPLAIGVAPNGNIAVADGGSSQQVKIFNSSGTLQTTLGQAGGYTNGPDVTTNKFYFANTKRPVGGQYHTDETQPFTFLTYQPDGSFWVGDTGNCRMLHYSSSNAYVEQVMNLGYHYALSVDANNPARLFGLYLEFAVDYTKPLLPNNGSWTLTKNWSYGVNAAVYDDLFVKFSFVTTLPNNRTYAFMRKQTGGVFEIVELTATGIRYTGVTSANLLCALQKNGDIYYLSGTALGQQPTYKKQTLTGFDGSGNPQYSAQTTVLTLPVLTATDPIGETIYSGLVTDTGVLVTMNGDNFNDGVRGAGWHIGLAKDNGWVAKTAPATRRSYQGNFPPNGDFDIGNSVGYTSAQITSIERSVFQPYNGEFWKGAQTNKWNHFYDNGLFVGQFGITRPETIGDAPAMMAGNVKNIGLVKVGSDYYLYHGDESFHGGVHRWKISGLNTIATQTISFVKAGTPVLPSPNYIDLMAGLPTSGTLVSGTGRWTYSPTLYNSSYSDAWTADLGLTVYKGGERSIQFRSAATGAQTRDAYCNIGTTNSTTWTITGQLTYPAVDELNDNFVDVLDANDKVLLRISRPRAYPTISVLANSTVIHAEAQDSFKTVFTLSQPLRIRSTGTAIIVKYADYDEVSVGLFDSSGNIATPKTLRIRQVSTGFNEHMTSVANFRFYQF